MRRREFLLSTLAGALATRSARAWEGPLPASVIVLWMQGGPSQLETFDVRGNRHTSDAALDVFQPIVAR